MALTDDGGTLALANLRLEEMFGYEHAELIGRPVESLVPADLQAAHRGHRAAYAQAPRARPMRAGARLVALRKDETTFPAEISLSPVTTAADTSPSSATVRFVRVSAWMPIYRPDKARLSEPISLRSPHCCAAGMLEAAKQFATLTDTFTYARWHRLTAGVHKTVGPSCRMRHHPLDNIGPPPRFHRLRGSLRS